MCVLVGEYQSLACTSGQYGTAYAWERILFNSLSVFGPLSLSLILLISNIARTSLGFDCSSFPCHALYPPASLSPPPLSQSLPPSLCV